MVSIIALWRAYFVRFKPLILTGDLFFKIFPIKDSEEKWYIPSATVTINVANEGARPGAILGFRITVRYPKNFNTNQYEVLVPVFELDASKNETIGQNRFSWLDKHSVGNWVPIIIPTGETVTKRYVFETRWDNPIAPEVMVLSLEAFTSSEKRWRKVTEWEIPLDVNFWAYFTGMNGGMRFSPKGEVLVWGEKHSQDLHKSIIYDGPIPASWSDSVEPSYLAYNEDNRPLA